MENKCIDIFNNFKLPTEDTIKLDIVIEHFKNYFELNKNTEITHYKFFTCVQQKNEPVDSFVSKLNNLSEDCCFENQEESLERDLLIIGIWD